jgi:hypothetical protein
MSRPDAQSNVSEMGAGARTAAVSSTSTVAVPAAAPAAHPTSSLKSNPGRSFPALRRPAAQRPAARLQAVRQAPPRIMMQSILSTALSAVELTATSPNEERAPTSPPSAAVSQALPLRRRIRQKSAPSPANYRKGSGDGPDFGRMLGLSRALPGGSRRASARLGLRTTPACRGLPTCRQYSKRMPPAAGCPRPPWPARRPRSAQSASPPARFPPSGRRSRQHVFSTARSRCGSTKCNRRTLT